MKKLLSVLFVSILVLAGCGNKATSEVVNLEFQHSMIEQDRIDAIQVMIDQFNSENSDIVVTQVPVNEDQYNEKIVTQGSSGQLPAVMQVGKDVLGTMSSYNYIDTEANNEAMKNIGEDKFFKGVLDLSKDEAGTNYLMIPNDAWVQGLWYNKQALADANIEVPKTVSDILAAAEKLNKDGNYGIVLPTDESTFTQQVFSQVALANEANIVDQSGAITFNTEAMTKSLEEYKTLTSYSQAGSVNIDQVKDAFLSGKTAMTFYSTYMFPALAEAGTTADYGFTPINDSEGNPVAFGNPSGITVTTGLDEQERAAAIKFTEYMSSKEVQTEWNLMTVGGGLPARTDVLESTEYQSNEVVKGMADIMDVLKQSLEGMESFGTVDGKNFNVLGPVTDARIIPTAINQLVIHEADVKTVVDGAQTEMESL